MKIIVCLKQVPASSQVEVDPCTGVLKREGVASKMNPYDLYALELALQLSHTYGGDVQALTMGPPQARSVVSEGSDLYGRVGGRGCFRPPLCRFRRGWPPAILCHRRSVPEEISI